MPFIFIPSGVKPVINLKIVEQYKTAYEAFTESELLCILGYSINTDDEHIQNFIRERLALGKKVILFLYSQNGDSCNEITNYKKMFSYSQYLEIIPIENAEDFRINLEEQIKDF